VNPNPAGRGKEGYIDKKKGSEPAPTGKKQKDV